MQANFQLKSNHADGSVKIEGNKLVLPADLDKDTYYASISSVLIDHSIGNIFRDFLIQIIYVIFFIVYLL